MQSSQELEEFFADMHVLKRIIHKHAEVGGTSTPTKAQLGILLALHPHDPKGIKELAEQFSMTSSAVTQLIDPLCEQGFVVRSPSSNDRRRICLTLCRKGEKFLQKTHAQRISRLRELFAPLNHEEIHQLRTIQKKIIEHFTNS